MLWIQHGQQHELFGGKRIKYMHVFLEYNSSTTFDTCRGNVLSILHEGLLQQQRVLSVMRPGPSILLTIGVVRFWPLPFAVLMNHQAICIDNAGAGAGERQPAGIEGSGLQSTGASQHATGMFMSEHTAL